jgi:hypothetical protein
LLNHRTTPETIAALTHAYIQKCSLYQTTRSFKPSTVITLLEFHLLKHPARIPRGKFIKRVQVLVR